MRAIMQKLPAFEENLSTSLKRLLGGAWPKILGVAASGGADSTSLLCGLAAIRDRAKNERGAKNQNCSQAQEAADQNCSQGQEAAAPQNPPFPKIVCVTVDHSIRPEAESSGDAAFVRSLCASLGVECFARKIERGLVEKTAAERGKGLEDAARFLRYQEFEAFANESGANFICLAHNQNDFLETVLMRFLQGAGSGAASGIAARRGIFLRPLLETSRSQIEEYLRKIGQSWRTDATNCDNSYLRNKIRNLLVPFLEENFCGWKKALLAGAQKAAYEDEALEAALDEKLREDFLQAHDGGGLLGVEEYCLQAHDGGGVEFSREFFGSLPTALRQRLLYRAFGALAAAERVPYSFVKEISLWPQKDFKNIAAAGLEAHSKKDKVFIKKSRKEATESGFFDIIMEDERCGGPCVLRSAAAGDKAGNDF